MEKKLNFKVCGLPAKYFIPFFIIVMATVYLALCRLLRSIPMMQASTWQPALS